MTDYVISDLHLGHTNCITKFTRADGSPLRDFKDVDEMNATIIKNINDVVKADDRLYILGDVVINKKHIDLMDQIVCENRYLIGGNHDMHYELLAPKFKKIYGCLEYNHCILTHIPVHSGQKKRFKANLHGHLHGYNLDLDGNAVQTKDNLDPWYINLSVEQLNYTPVDLQDLTRKFQ